MIEDGREILIGQTETIQDFEAWGERDFGRPARDPKSGMLPPKLARLMINLSGIDLVGKTLLDPFCGSGTVLAEASLMGLQKIIGSDISEKAMKDTKKNLRWLASLYDQSFLTFQLDVAACDQVQLSEPVDLVVTEPFLGPPLRGGESRAELLQIISELTELYVRSFVHIAEFMKKRAILVVAFPVFAHTLSITKPLPGFRLQKRFRYERHGQRVARDIFVFEKE